MLAVASAAAAVVLSRSVFPFLSVDNDDAINRLQADAIANGHLFMPTLGLPDALRPWLAAVVDNHFVLKYTPVVPAMIAVSEVLTGGTSAYLALLAAAAVVMTYLLAVEVLGDRVEALVATVLVAASPLVLIHSALLLSYLPTFVLLETFAWSLIRGTATGRRALMAVSGLAWGTAFFARPYDAVVFGLPLVVWVGLRRSAGRRLLPLITSFGLAAAVPVAGLLAFNAAATGSALRLPFALLEPSDRLGFGIRKLYATDPLHDFGLIEGLRGMVSHAALFDLWAAGGLLLVVLAVVTVARRRVEGPGWALVAMGVLVPLSYIVFWGPWNATVLWRGTRFVGPFYFLPVLLPLALFGARGLVDVFRRQHLAGLAAGAVIVALTAVSLVGIVDDNLGFTRQNRALSRLVDRHGGDQLVFTTLPTPFLMHPSPVVANGWDASGPIVYAVALGDADVDAARRMPDRTPYRLRFDSDFREPDADVGGRLERLRLVAGSQVEIRVVARRPNPIMVHRPTPPPRVGLAVSTAGVTRLYPLGDAPVYEERLLIDAAGVEVAGRTASSDRPAEGSAALQVGLVVWPPGEVAFDAETSSAAADQRLPMRRTGDTVEMLVPTGPVWTTEPQAASPALLELSA